MVEFGEEAEGVEVGEVSPLRVFVHIVYKVFDSHFEWLYLSQTGGPGPFPLVAVGLPLWESWRGGQLLVSGLY